MLNTNTYDSRFSTIPLVLFYVDYEKNRRYFYVYCNGNRNNENFTGGNKRQLYQHCGLAYTELLYNEENREWTMIQHWASMEELKAASDKMFQDEGAAPFVKALDAASVKMSILPQIKIWG